MAGYLQDPLQIINLITDNLRDRYKSGFPVLKEIIQNTDDAGECDENLHLEFGLSAGIPLAQHQLLKGPALYFINNGKFKDSDSKAIRSFGLNSKAIEQTSIGKFGLGMKSVFHFCETFFFLAKNTKRAYAEVLNPWSGDKEFPSFHDDWNVFSDQDVAMMKNQIKSVLEMMDLSNQSFFVLWLPLRQNEHLKVGGREVGSIISEFPGDNPHLLSFLFESDLAQRLASILPLLQRVTHIRFWDRDQKPFFTVDLDKRSKRIRKDSVEQNVLDLVGAVAYSGQNLESKDSLLYVGKELLIDSPELKTLRESPLWPKSYVRDEFGMSTVAPDKAQGHSAAVFSRSKAEGEGTLIINWAVFLPVAEEKSETIRCSGGITFRLTLHGYFFVDAGRMDIEGIESEELKGNDIGEPANEADLRKRWNGTIAQKGTLPLVLPALDKFVVKSKLSPDSIWSISKGFEYSKLFHHYRANICADFSWVCCLTRQGREWRLLPSEHQILPLPSTPVSAPDRPWETLPKLESFQERKVALLQSDAPHLHLKSLPIWHEADLLAVLHLREREVFSDQGRFDYLLQFLTAPSVSQYLKVGSLQERLQQIAGRVFTALGTELRQQRKKMQEFVSIILPAGRYPLQQDAPQVIRELQKCQTEVLILAGEFDSPNSLGAAKLTLEDGLTLLKKLHDLISQSDKPKLIADCRAIGREILERQDEEWRRAIFAEADGLKILEGYDCMEDKLVAISAAELRDCQEAGLLFLYSSGLNDAQRRGLAPKLQKAVKERVILIKKGTSELAFGFSHKLVSCHADSVLDTLGLGAKLLRPIEGRWQLLSDVAGADLESPQRVRGLRYLMHGLAKHFNDHITLWVSGYDQSPVWGKLWQQLESHQVDNWNLLERKIVEEIPSNKWQRLSIREIKPEGILEDLRVNGTFGIRGEQFSQDERNAVLRELVSDEELWKNLPFHETIEGELVDISDLAYLETDISLPDELYSAASIIKRSIDSSIWRQQKEWLTPLSEEGVIRIVLSYESPAKFWRLVMDNLGAADELLQSSLLRNTAWLPDVDNVPVKPADVVYLENMQDEVDRLLVAARGAYWSPEKLNADLRQHASFSLLGKFCFATGKDGIEKVALLLGETNEYHVGRVEYNEDINRIVRACVRMPVKFCMPGWTLLASAIDTYSLDIAKELLFPEAAKPISVKQIIAVLSWLQEEHIKVNKELKKDIIAAFNAYLAALVNEGGGMQEISQILLLNREGFWKMPSELCAGLEGISDEHVLDEYQRSILTDKIFEATRYEQIGKTPLNISLDETEVNKSAKYLEEYFIPWEGLVAPDVICAFLTLFGDEKGISLLANRYKGRYEIPWILDNLPWKAMDYFGKNIQQAFAQHKFEVKVHKGVKAKVYSIQGDEIDIPVNEKFNTLIVGGLFGFTSGNTLASKINLRIINPEEKSSSQLVALLKSSAEYLLMNCYRQEQADLSSLWEKLDHSEQLDIRIAQQLVLNSLPFYLRQLGVHKHPQLQDLLNQWNDARYKKEEYYDLKEKKQGFEDQERDVLSKVQALLKKNEEVQKVVLSAVRSKIKDFQYTFASIPFELFQNADDAVVELAMIKIHPNVSGKLEEDILPDHARRFLVVANEDSLTIAHWGRQINAVGSAGFPGEEKGFNQDLEKMLVLSSSDKAEKNRVTGKFGLGFKSVLLACERPRLMSGRLVVEIIAGLCPIPLKDSSRLRSQLHEWSSDRKWPGTILELPLTENTAMEIMNPFSRLAGFMTIFSKQIRRIDIHGDINQSWEWKPEKIYLSETACLELGELPLPNGSLKRGLSVYFRLPGGGMLFSLGPGGFRVLPAELPAIWVVAPTKELDGLGFAINCLFDLDAGRARLAGNSNVNKQKAHELGRAFGQSLQQLYRLVQEQWEELKTSLRFEVDLTPYDFWATFWKIMEEGVQFNGSEDIRTLLVGLLCGDNGIGYLLSREDAMPNGLWGEYKTLTRPGNVRLILKGCLANENIFRGLVEWNFLPDFLGAPEAVVSEEVFAVARKLSPALGQARTQWRSVRLSDVLCAYSDPEKKISPDIAQKLGRLLNHGSLKQEDFEKERGVIEKTLHTFSFKTQDGSFRSSDEILVLQKNNQANPDEAKRAAFAAEDHILSEEYQGSGLDFFFICREKINVPLEKLARWLLEAPTEQKKENGLRYLLDGEHGEKVAWILRERGLGGSWLIGLRPDSPCFIGWDENDILEILFRKLPTITELHRLHTATEEDFYDPPEEELQRYDPQEILQKIHAWWMDTKEEHLADYEQQVYPERVTMHLAEDDVGRIDRKSWLVLFTLSHFHTMGRQRDFQHKGFIDQCIQKGWWDTFSEERPEQKSDAWMGVLEKYIDDQVDLSQYEFWMNRFPAIYKFSRWLEEYKDAFLSTERTKDLSGIAGILKTRVNSAFQGGGVSAPPIEKSLGYGACFTLRELKRKRVINGRQVVPFCYVPVKRVRGFCEWLGCQELTDKGGIDNSRMIHRFLCSNLGEVNAEFANCYDIPLQVVAEREGLLRMILN